MFKLAIKVLVLAFLMTGAFTLFAGGTHASAATNCSGAPYGNWGNRGGDGQGLMASMMTYAQYENGNPINTQYTVNTTFPSGDNAKIFKWPIGSSGRDATRNFNTGEHLSGNGGIDCNGWSVIGPGTDGHVGNGYVIDCGDAFQHTKVSISHVDNPGGAAGRWELRYNDVTYSNDVNANGATVPFDVNNGGSVQIKLIWHPDAPQGNVNAQRCQNNIKVTGVRDAFSSNPESTVTLTGNEGTPNTFVNNGTNYGIGVPDWVKNRTGGTDVQVRLYVRDSTGTNQLVSSSTIREPWGNSCDGTSTSNCTNATITDDHLTNSAGKHSYTLVTITGTNHNVADPDPNATIGWDTPGSSHTYGFRAMDPVIHITAKHFYVGQANPYHTDTWSYQCLHASCDTPTYQSDGSLPNNVVEAGHPFTVYVPIINDNTSPDAQVIPYEVGDPVKKFSATQMNGANPIEHDTNFGLNVGDRNVVPITYTAPNDVTEVKLAFYPDIYGNGSLGGSIHGSTTCDITVPVYKKFALEPHAKLTYNSDEDPGPITYQTYVTNTSGTTASAPTTSSFTQTPYGGGSRCSNAGPVSTDGPFNANSSKDTIAPATCTPSAITAGDRYCARINFTGGYNEGYAGPGGAIALPSLNPNNAGSEQCFTVVNKPYFKTLGQGASAGGDFKQPDGACTSGSGGGLLAGWNNNTGGVDRGSGSQLSALAFIKATGFASAQTNISRSPTDLTYANTKAGDISSSIDSPALGGNYNPGGSRCLTDVEPRSGETIQSDGYVYPGKTNINKAESVFVDGNVYINGNITYASSWTDSTKPSFVLRATGNIYIAPGVTELDGLYISKNKIYTCASNSSGNFASIAGASAYGTCNKQLQVFGSFIAKQVNLLRTFGSLRDEKPTPGSPAIPGTPFRPGALGPLTVSESGGRGCTAITEPGDTDYTREDQFFICMSPADEAAGNRIGWTNNGDDEGLRSQGLSHCTDAWDDVLEQINYDHHDTRDWDDNYLCSTLRGISFQQRPSIPEYCTSVAFDRGRRVAYVCVDKGSTASPGTPAVPPGAPSAPVCSTAGAHYTRSCSAEIFWFSPVLYMTTPNIQPPNGGATMYDSITSLPPVL